MQHHFESAEACAKSFDDPARDRWQQHLKTRGQHYHDEARAMEALGAQHPSVGAQAAALALHALAEVMERARLARLTRHQHVLLRLGELIAYAECAAAACRRAVAAAEDRRYEKTDGRFDAAALAALGRIFAREAARTVASEGLLWVCAAGGVPAGDVAALEAALNLSAIHRAQIDLIGDLDLVADVLYQRAGNRRAAA